MRVFRTILILMTGVSLLAPAHAQLLSTTEKEPVTSIVAEVGENVVNTAMKYIGVRYRRGANGPKSFDCSGFTSFVFRQKNVALTRTSRTQYNEGKPVSNIADLRPGDLVFFSGSQKSKIVGHVGIVKELNADSSDVSFVHASRTGVKVDMLSSAYYKTRYLGARRVL